MQRKPNISFEDFLRVDLRVGTVKRADAVPEARNPALKLWIWFGEDIGELKTSAQITDLYQPNQLIGRQLIAVVNFPAKQIGPFMSECLVTGVVDGAGVVTLLQPDLDVEDGLSIA